MHFVWQHFSHFHCCCCWCCLCCWFWCNYSRCNYTNHGKLLRLLYVCCHLLWGFISLGFCCSYCFIICNENMSTHTHSHTRSHYYVKSYQRIAMNNINKLALHNVMEMDESCWVDSRRFSACIRSVSACCTKMSCSMYLCRNFILFYPHPVAQLAFKAPHQMYLWAGKCICIALCFIIFSASGIKICNENFVRLTIWKFVYTLAIQQIYIAYMMLQ